MQHEIRIILRRQVLGYWCSLSWTECRSISGGKSNYLFRYTLVLSVNPYAGQRCLWDTLTLWLSVFYKTHPAFFFFFFPSPPLTTCAVQNLCMLVWFPDKGLPAGILSDNVALNNLNHNNNLILHGYLKQRMKVQEWNVKCDMPCSNILFPHIQTHKDKVLLCVCRSSGWASDHTHKQNTS